jgi:hypothetical protein
MCIVIQSVHVIIIPSITAWRLHSYYQAYRTLSPYRNHHGCLLKWYLPSICHSTCLPCEHPHPPTLKITQMQHESKSFGESGNITSFHHFLTWITSIFKFNTNTSGFKKFHFLIKLNFAFGISPIMWNAKQEIFFIDQHWIDEWEVREKSKMSIWRKQWNDSFLFFSKSILFFPQKIICYSFKPNFLVCGLSHGVLRGASVKITLHNVTLSCTAQRKVDSS